MDEDTAIALFVGAIAALCIGLAVRSLSQRRTGVGIAWLVGGAVFGFVALFFATFQIRMF